jgi:hypothetical protein
MVTIFDLLYIAITVYYIYRGLTEHSGSILLEGIIFGLFALTFSLGIISIRRKRAGKGATFIIPMQIAFPAMLLSMLFFFTLNDYMWDQYTVHDESFTLTGTADNDHSIDSEFFTIKKSGIYRMDLEVHMDGGTMTVSIKDDKGNAVYQETGGDFSVDRRELKLKEGEYRTSYTYQYSDYDPDKAKISVDMKIRK